MDIKNRMFAYCLWAIAWQLAVGSEGTSAQGPAEEKLPSISVFAPYTSPGTMSDKLSPELQKQIASRNRNKNFGATKKQTLLTDIGLDRDATFAELKARFAKARREQDVHPCGYSGLHILYATLKAGDFRKAAGDKELLRWVEEEPADPTPLVVLGARAVTHAWEARGDGPGFTVPEAQFIEFRKRLQVARDYLLRAQKLEPNDPHLYAALINTALGLDTERAQVEAWVAAGQKAFPRYRYLYESIGNYLLPKWHGDRDDLPQLAGSFLKSLKGDDGYEAFSVTLMEAADHNADLIYLSGLQPADLLRGAKVLFARYPQDDSIYDYCGLVAMRNLDQEFCRQLLPQLLKLERDDTLSPRVWRNIEFFDQFVNFAAAPPPKDQPERSFYLHVNGANGVAFVEGAKGPLLVATTDREPAHLSVWDLNDVTKPLRYWPVENPRCIYVLQSNGPGRLLAAHCSLKSGPHVTVYDTTEKREPVLIPCAEIPGECHFSKDGSRLAIVYENAAEIFDPAVGGSVLQRIGPFHQTRWGAVQNAFSDDGKRLAMFTREGLLLWDAETGKQLKQFDAQAHKKVPGGTAVTWPLAIDAAHRRVAASATAEKDPRRKEMPLFTLTRQGEPDFQPEKVGEIAGFQRVIAKHGNELAAAITTFPGTTPEKWVIELYDLQTGKRLRTIDGHPCYLTTTSFSLDGRWYATTDMMGATRLWEVPRR